MSRGFQKNFFAQETDGIVGSLCRLAADQLYERVSEDAGGAERLGQRIAAGADLNEQGPRRLMLVEPLRAQVQIPAEPGRAAVQKRLQLQGVGQILLPVRVGEAASSVPTTSMSSAQASPSG